MLGSFVLRAATVLLCVGGVAGVIAAPNAWRLARSAIQQPGPPEYDTATQDGPIYFAPAANLESVDVRLIRSAHSTINVAMYTFTDRLIGSALVAVADRGVHVRVYRDRDLFRSEYIRGGQVLAILAHHANIQIRVKGSIDLMHEKAFLVDSHVLRDGSGNWSSSAARYQGNEITITSNRDQTCVFAANCETMWIRTGNEVIQ